MYEELDQDLDEIDYLLIDNKSKFLISKILNEIEHFEILAIFLYQFYLRKILIKIT